MVVAEVESQDVVKEKSHYEALYHEIGDHHFISAGYEEIHALTVDTLPSGSKILDIGAGSGQHTRRFAEKGHDVTGIELSEHAVSLGNEKFKELGIQAKLVAGDVRKIPAEDQSYDAAFLSLILHHFLDYEPVLREAARVTRDKLFIFEPNAKNPQSYLLLNVVNPIFKPGFLTPNQRAIHPQDVKAILESCGFQEVETRYLTIGSTNTSPVKKLLRGAQSVLPDNRKHNKFVSVYERKS